MYCPNIPAVLLNSFFSFVSDFVLCAVLNSSLYRWWPPRTAARISPFLMDCNTRLEQDKCLMIIYVVAGGLKSTSSEFKVN